jgi:hypothetical protein
MTLVGLLANAYSVLAFGTQYVWLRKHSTADGLFAYWLMSISISFVGVLSNLACGLPQFQPLAMLGGCIWAVGTTVSLPLINTLGLGLAILIGANVTTIVGWLIGRLGVPGVVQGAANVNPWLNYAGMLGVLVGSAFYASVKPTVGQRDESNEADLAEGTEKPMIDEETDSNRLSTRRKVVAISGLIFSGTCYGLLLLPVIYIQEHPQQFTDPPSSAICYAHSHYTGILLTSTLIFVGYCIYVSFGGG